MWRQTDMKQNNGLCSLCPSSGCNLSPCKMLSKYFQWFRCKKVPDKLLISLYNSSMDCGLYRLYILCVCVRRE